MPEGPHPHRRQRRGGARAALALRGELSLVAAAALAALAAASCDQGKQHDTLPNTPYIHLVSANVGTSTPLPADGQIELTFDRLLNPVTVVRQSIVLRNADDSPVASPPVISYDPVALKVVISDPDPKGGPGHAWLTPTAFYKITLGIPDPGAFGAGLRAIDGQTLDPASTLVIGFSAAAPANAPTCMSDADCKLAYAPVCDGTTNHCRAPKIRFCDDIQPIFVNRCSAGQCHGAPVTGGPQLPAEGLILETSIGVAKTAVGQVSQESNTGALAGRTEAPGRTFGVNMPIIDPGIGGGGDPGNSWMMYKLLLAKPSDPSAPETSRLCGPGPTALAAPIVPSAAMSDAERAILSDFVLGREMPYPSFPGGVPAGKPDDNPPLTLAQLERLRLWIAQGAPVDSCSCQ